MLGGTRLTHLCLAQHKPSQAFLTEYSSADKIRHFIGPMDTGGLAGDSKSMTEGIDKNLQDNIPE
jgi:hypothetical protein